MAATNEKFCLKWNDFEHNVSSAFNAIREEKDFFDVTLVCDNKQVEAHKVIIAACSPFFKSILRRNPHQHPLLYLKGVLYDDLVSVLHFMYKGEVNIAQEQLNSFLAVAEDLQVKGLTQDGQNGGGAKPESSLKSSSKPFHPAPATSSTAQIKRQKVAPSTSQSFVDTGDDDIQEVVPVKTEPSQLQQVDPHQSQGVLAPMEDQNYVEEGYEDYAEDQQYEDYSNMGDGTELSKGSLQMSADELNATIAMKIIRADTKYQCADCGYETPTKQVIENHVERHIQQGVPCELCGKISPTRHAWRMHLKRAHRTTPSSLSICQK